MVSDYSPSWRGLLPPSIHVFTLIFNFFVIDLSMLDAVTGDLLRTVKFSESSQSVSD